MGQIEKKQHMPFYLEGLNEKQVEAVQNTEGPLLVLAGAGTGKTRVLTTRLAHILADGRATPAQILAVTFTNKAATEMKQRVSDILGGQNVEGWWLGTFHSLSARMLRRHADLVDLRSNFTILDSDDQVRLVKQLLEVEGLESKKANANAVAAMISNWKDKALNPNDVTTKVNYDDQVGQVPLAKVAQIYRQYQERLQTLNACDFGDLLLHMINIFKEKDNGVLAQYHARFKYLLVDEYQDTNGAQYLWLRLLAQKHHNICCVGDDDQSIYGWRGAEIGNILKFEKDYADAKTVRLEQNYRSTEHILSAANGLIANNSGRLGKDLWSDEGSGEKVNITGVWDGEREARLICDEIESFQNRGVSLEDIAVLVRASSQMRSFEERFNTLGINYRVVGGPRFYERKEIRDALAYLRMVAQADDDLALERIINTPKRGIGKKSIQDLQKAARTMGTSLNETILKLIETDELRPQLRSSLRQLMEDFDRWRRQLGQEDHAALAGIILDESGYTKMWQDDDGADAPGRLDNLKELVNAMDEFPDMQAFLEHVSLVMENQQNLEEDQVSLMTLHAAKGLEFDVVFLPGWEEGLFPSQRSMDEKGLDGLEEERRLAYVGLTRAKRYAYISHAANRRTYGSWISSVQSRFISEIPQAHAIETSEVSRNSYGDSSQRRLPEWAVNRGTSSRFQGNQDVEIIPPSGSNGKFSRGERVFHQKFGYGIIKGIDGDKLDISFDKAGQKRVIDSFVEKS